MRTPPPRPPTPERGFLTIPFQPMTEITASNSAGVSSFSPPSESQTERGGHLYIMTVARSPEPPPRLHPHFSMWHYYPSKVQSTPTPHMSEPPSPSTHPHILHIIFSTAALVCRLRHWNKTHPSAPTGAPFLADSLLYSRLDVSKISLLLPGSHSLFDSAPLWSRLTWTRRVLFHTLTVSSAINI